MEERFSTGTCSRQPRIQNFSTVFNLGLGPFAKIHRNCLAVQVDLGILHNLIAKPNSVR